jgi:hydroxymethylbilane synthase
MNSITPSRTLTLAIGTRASKLALVQTTLVEEALIAAHPSVGIRVVPISTKGDIVLERPLREIGGAGLFVEAIEDALRTRRIDLAVHSAKDLPSKLPEDMALAVFPPRADSRDALISFSGEEFAGLPRGARVGTSSVRRICQLRHLRPDLQILDLRGNVDSRLRKLRDAEYNAIVLAKAGMDRLGLTDEITQVFSPELLLPAVAQGALAVEVRADDATVAELLAPLDHVRTRLAVLAERGFLERIGGGCHAPVAAYAEVEGTVLTLTGMVGAEDGQLVQASSTREVGEDVLGAAQLGAELAEKLLASGGADLLRGE